MHVGELFPGVHAVASRVTLRDATANTQRLTGLPAASRREIAGITESRLDHRHTGRPSRSSAASDLVSTSGPVEQRVPPGRRLIARLPGRARLVYAAGSSDGSFGWGRGQAARQRDNAQEAIAVRWRESVGATLFVRYRSGRDTVTGRAMRPSAHDKPQHARAGHPVAACVGDRARKPERSPPSPPAGRGGSPFEQTSVCPLAGVPTVERRGERSDGVPAFCRGRNAPHLARMSTSAPSSAPSRRCAVSERSRSQSTMPRDGTSRVGLNNQPCPEGQLVVRARSRDVSGATESPPQLV